MTFFFVVVPCGAISGCEVKKMAAEVYIFFVCLFFVSKGKPMNGLPRASALVVFVSNRKR